MTSEDRAKRESVAVPVDGLAWLVAAVTTAVALVCTGRDTVAFVLGVPLQEFWLSILRLDSELSIPAWYSGCLMFFAALLSLVLAWRSRTLNPRDFVWWLLLGLGFIYLSADEIAAIHERVMLIVNRYVQTSGPFTFAWLVVGVPAVIVIGALFVPFLLRLERRTKWLLVLSGAIFLSGAIGCEMLGGMASSHYGTFNTPAYFAASTLEECLELTGVTLLAVTLLLRIRDDFAGASITLG